MSRFEQPYLYHDHGNSSGAPDKKPRIVGLGHEEDLSDPVMMTEESYNYLLNKLQRLKNEAAEANRLKGEAADQGDWHDNFAYDQALRDAELADSNYAQLERKLQKVLLIERREVTTDVGIGNTVHVRFDGEDEDEQYTIVGEMDTEIGRTKVPRWISMESQLAKAILGKKRGDEVSFTNPDGRIIRVKVKRILPSTI